MNNGLTTQVFDNVKNLLVCALLFAAGSDALHSDHHLFMGLLGSNVTGWGLIGFSAVLMALNISDGLHRLANHRHHAVLQVILCLLYLILAVRVVEIVWSFRAN
ncbi:hypothetical protein D3C85_1666590 [compost metagenome]